MRRLQVPIESFRYVTRRAADDDVVLGRPAVADLGQISRGAGGAAEVEGTGQGDDRGTVHKVQ